jgi:hypothetical protein
VSGTLRHAKIDISGAYPNRYTGSYDGPLARDTGRVSFVPKWNVAFTTTNSPFNHITVTPYHVNNNDAEWGPNALSGLHGTSDG